MGKIKQFETLIVEEVEQTSEEAPSEHGHNFFEIIYILNGQGYHYINKTALPYKQGNLFLLSPEDEHYFDIKEKSRFAIIRFTDHYFTQKRHLTTDETLVIHPTDLIRSQVLKENIITFNGPCSGILSNTIANILAYKCKVDLSDSAIIFYQIMTILGMVREELLRMDADLTNEQPSKERLLSYIHQHIYNPEDIQIKSIAGHFHISASYFSAYFKRNFSMSYREYVEKYKLKLIEKRIATGKTSLKQIADEFGFTDESHLSKYFKQKKNIRPTLYRKEHSQ
ncbi:AraC family transcriptional regulator [Chitinophaga sp. S165]|uniref:AraC family transcriptional regulator n=1 Tax=Chitinophaga sp. S165 TaxID=2135462 RepID=UPI000D712E96|nr:AraC family transcriptional regulator [Chitinophaga sp. S165]PWV46573.1 AraC-like DNA-binding protein [Chitinophaga sp. S165]